MALVIRLEFGGEERPLKARHKHVRQAVAASGNRSVTELLNDPFGGWPYLLQALVNAKTTQSPISLDKASELIDAYSDQHDGIIGLGEALGKLLGDYVNREATPTDKEVEDAEVSGTAPKGGTPAATGPTDD